MWCSYFSSNEDLIKAICWSKIKPIDHIKLGVFFWILLEKFLFTLLQIWSEMRWTHKKNSLSCTIKTKFIFRILYSIWSIVVPFLVTLEHLTEIWMRLYLVPKCFSSPFIWITNEEHQEIDPKRSFVLECHHPLPATYFIFKTVCYVFLEVKPPYLRQLNIWIIHIYFSLISNL